MFWKPLMSWLELKYLKLMIDALLIEFQHIIHVVEMVHSKYTILSYKTIIDYCECQLFDDRQLRSQLNQ